MSIEILSYIEKKKSKLFTEFPLDNKIFVGVQDI